MNKPNIKFIPKDNKQFTKTLKQRIDNYFKEKGISKNANFKMKLKSATMISIYVVPFICYIVFQPSLPITLLLFTIMGVGIAGIGMSVMHDGAHGSYSKDSRVNFLMAHTINIAGGAVANWKLQHNVLHHTFTNITHYDDDIMERALLRFSPHAKHHPHQRFQHFYAWFFYSLLTLYWVVAKDFVQFFKYNKEGVNKETPEQRSATFRKIIAVKVVYYLAFLVFPIMYLDLPWHYTVLGFLLMHLVAGLILSLVFQMAHTLEIASFPLPNEEHVIEDEWAVHQLKTTVNFARKNTFITWYVGGLNYQVEHHLFPNICHIHYPDIAPIVKQTAEEFGIPYLEKETFSEALICHVQMLKKLGNNEAIQLATT
jgi:linoleoyl-CoA desaturase